MKLDTGRLITALLVGLFMISVHTTYHRRLGVQVTRSEATPVVDESPLRETVRLDHLQRPALPETILGQTQAAH